MAFQSESYYDCYYLEHQWYPKTVWLITFQILVMLRSSPLRIEDEVIDFWCVLFVCLQHVIRGAEREGCTQAVYSGPGPAGGGHRWGHQS